MTSAQLPARTPERVPEPANLPRESFPRTTKKATRFVIKIGGVIPS